jgi:hypothetical protein
MEEASQVRRAAREAVGETVPERLRTRLLRALDAGSMTPGVLTLLSARAAASDGEDTDERQCRRSAETSDSPSPGEEALERRAAGVQLIYEGLGLTRTLAAEEPWADPSRDRIEADIAVLAADVLVARGFHLLARTECAGRAVETVRRFGYDQTGRRDSGVGSDTEPNADPNRDPGPDSDRDRNQGLEADALDLATRCGLTAVGAEVPPDLTALVTDLASSTDEDGFPAPEDLLSPSATDSLAALLGDEPTGMSEGVPPATDR